MERERCRDFRRQELATRVSHRNTGKYTNDPRCENLLSRIATDENLHMICYHNLMNAAPQLSPDQALVAILQAALLSSGRLRARFDTPKAV